jgi:hypothetical protein
MLEEVFVEMLMLRTRLSQFPVSYYFRTDEEVSSLPGALYYLRGLAIEGTRAAHSEIRLASALLSGAIVDFLKLVAQEHLRMPCDDLALVARDYARDHMREIMPFVPVHELQRSA